MAPERPSVGPQKAREIRTIEDHRGSPYQSYKAKLLSGGSGNVVHYMSLPQPVPLYHGTECMAAAEGAAARQAECKEKGQNIYEVYHDIK
jgi:hypothetical protein